jgi:kynurenine formamidase
MHLIDLTLTIGPGMRGVEFEKRHTLEEHGWNSRILHLYSHSGTHVDAPFHFTGEDDQTIDRMELDRCVAPAWVVDLSTIKPNELISVAHLGRTADRIASDEGLLLRTGWSRYVDQADFYRDMMPRVSRELAEWCVERRIRLIGVETPSVAAVNCLEEVTQIHQILFGRRIVIVEGLTNLKDLQQERVLFCAVPLKIEGGDGSPCRAFAVEGLPWPDFSIASKSFEM